MDKLPWELISPIAFVVLGIALIIITGFYPVGPVKDVPQPVFTGFRISDHELIHGRCATRLFSLPSRWGPFV